MPFLLPLFLLQIQNNTENLYAEKQEFHSLLYSPHCNHQGPRHKRAMTLCGVIFLPGPLLMKMKLSIFFPGCPHKRTVIIIIIIVVGDSIVRNVGAEHVDMKVECFPGIKTEQLHRVMEKRDLVIQILLSFTWVQMTNEKPRSRIGRGACVGVYGKEEATEL